LKNTDTLPLPNCFGKQDIWDRVIVIIGRIACFYHGLVLSSHESARQSAASQPTNIPCSSFGRADAFKPQNPCASTHAFENGEAKYLNPPCSNRPEFADFAAFADRLPAEFAVC
jgi:hypothetical protein